MRSTPSNPILAVSTDKSVFLLIDIVFSELSILLHEISFHNTADNKLWSTRAFYKRVTTTIVVGRVDTTTEHTQTSKRLEVHQKTVVTKYNTMVPKSKKIATILLQPLPNVYNCQILKFGRGIAVYTWVREPPDKHKKFTIPNAVAVNSHTDINLRYRPQFFNVKLLHWAAFFTANRKIALITKTSTLPWYVFKLSLLLIYEHTQKSIH